MKYIDNNLNRIDKNEIDFDIENYYKNMISFVENLGIEKELALQIYYDSLSFILEITDGKKYQTKYNDTINTYSFPNNVGAFATLLDQKQTEDGFIVTPGICLRSNNINRDKHIFTHESFHAFSYKTDLLYNEKGINYTKTGMKIMYYDRKDELINAKYNATGLNEGITELLTRKFLKENGNNPYHFQVIIAQIISSNDNSIFKSYFSRNDKDVIEYFNKFESNQYIMSGDELINMPKDIIVDINSLRHYLEAAISYDLNLVSEDRLEEEFVKIKSIVSELDLDLDYCLESGSYVDMVDDIIYKLKGMKK